MAKLHSSQIIKRSPTLTHHLKRENSKAPPLIFLSSTIKKLNKKAHLVRRSSIRCASHFCCCSPHCCSSQPLQLLLHLRSQRHHSAGSDAAPVWSARGCPPASRHSRTRCRCSAGRRLPSAGYRTTFAGFRWLCRGLSFCSFSADRTADACRWIVAVAVVAATVAVRTGCCVC